MKTKALYEITDRQLIRRLLAAMDADREFQRLRRGMGTPLGKLLREADRRFNDGLRWEESQGGEFTETPLHICYNYKGEAE